MLSFTLIDCKNQTKVGILGENFEKYFSSLPAFDGELVYT